MAAVDREIRITRTFRQRKMSGLSGSMSAQNVRPIPGQTGHSPFRGMSGCPETGTRTFDRARSGDSGASFSDHEFGSRTCGFHALPGADLWEFEDGARSICGEAVR